MKHFLLFAALAASFTASADRVLHFDMEADGQLLTDRISGSQLVIDGRWPAENLPGASGNALRFDGYSTFANGSVSLADATSMTFSVWVAPETYPVIALDRATNEKMLLAGTLDKTLRSGWGFELGYTGKYAFECYTGGWPLALEAQEPLPTYEWSHLVAVIDGVAGQARLYRNGEEVASSLCMTPQSMSGATQMYIGKSAASSVIDGVFNINTFNGLIDDVEVWNTALSTAEVIAFSVENEANLRVPSSRFAGQKMRPHFHGMPGANWTNESHGMTYSDGRWHVFFQKNGNGPYMTRLHWGHISSENLYDWQEEKIAIMPENNYDIKGCWSGCVISDPVVTGGKPAIIYTGVDYERARILRADPLDDTLLDWQKAAGAPVIDGRPQGLTDDFRDPYFFRYGDNAYIIVGSSVNSRGVATLHKYDPANKTFSNDGKLFFKATSAPQEGTFWEMPNITDMGDGRWLFTITPMGTSQGVRTLYRTGTINDDGTFQPDYYSSLPRGVELISRDGYGLLSPTIYQKDGKTIALGIVPDKISGVDNATLGWAHCYSLPREWSLDETNTLIQKPYEGLRELRSTEECYLATNLSISGSHFINPVRGRQVEMLGRFTVGANPFGFTFLGNASGAGKLTYNPSDNTLTVDLSALKRFNNDGHSYNGIYSCTLPETIQQGSELKLNLFIDGSILDIFVNDKWATSIRIFATADDADAITAFSTGGDTLCKELSAWKLVSKASSTAIGDILADGNEEMEGPLNVFTIDGVYVKSVPDFESAQSDLLPGLYIVGSRKLLVR